MATAVTAVVPTLQTRLGAMPPDVLIKWFNFLVYGEPGAGKTRLIGTAGASKLLGPVIIADVEGGTLTLRKMPGVDVVKIRTMSQFEKLVNDLANDTSKYYKTFGVDSVTELQKLDMETVMGEQFKKKPETTDIYVPSQREWGKSGSRMREILRAARDLEMHTIVTAMEAQETDDQTGITKYYPSIPGKLKSEIAGFFDVVGRLEAKPTPGNNAVIVRTLQTAKTNKVVAKDRFDCLPQLIEDPTLPKMWEVINA